MRRFRNILFALAAFLWLPASAHCLLESVHGFEFLQCVADSQPADHHCDDCGCCTVEKAQYRAETAGLQAPAPELVAVRFEAAPLPVAALPAGISHGVLTVPPEIVPTRHFLFRTALSPRAPSCLS